MNHPLLPALPVTSSSRHNRRSGLLGRAQGNLAVLGAALLLGLAGQAAAVTLVQSATYTVTGASVKDVAWFPEGKRAVVAADSTVLLLDSQGKVQRQWLAFDRPVTDVAVSPDGLYVAARTRAQVAVWRVSDGRELQRKSLKGGRDLGFTGTGEVLLLDTALNALNIQTGRQRLILDQEQAPAELYVSANGTRAVLIWEASAQLVTTAAPSKPLVERELDESESVRQVEFSPDGKTAVILTDVSFVITEGADPVELPEDVDKYGAIALLDNENVSYFDGESVQKYSLTSGEAVGEKVSAELGGTPRAGGQNLLISFGDSEKVQILDAETFAVKASFTPLSGNVTVGGFLPTGQVLAGIGEAREFGVTGAKTVPNLPKAVRILKMAGGNLWASNAESVGIIKNGRYTKLVDLPEDRGGRALELNAAGTFAVATSYEGLSVVSLATGKITKALSAEQLKMEDVHEAIPTPDGKALILIPHTGDVVRYELSTGKQTLAYAVAKGDEPLRLAMSAGGTLVVTLTNDTEDRIALIKPGSTKAFKTVPVPGYIEAVALSPDGKTLAVSLSSAPQGVLLIDVATGNIVARGPHLALGTPVVAWSANGKQLLIGAGVYGREGSVNVLDVR
ncbi:WD40 repeat domain-containing protein [Deinococcus oregonensis]|uniref:WD40 repeat domain-containing protein n=1 Tax=Deinococcus oregonensis TaxID=1805970 RepID=A0ABV6B7J9_9DEIO